MTLVRSWHPHTLTSPRTPSHLPHTLTSPPHPHISPTPSHLPAHLYISPTPSHLPHTLTSPRTPLHLPHTLTSPPHPHISPTPSHLPAHLYISPTPSHLPAHLYISPTPSHLPHTLTSPPHPHISPHTFTSPPHPHISPHTFTSPRTPSHLPHTLTLPYSLSPSPLSPHTPSQLMYVSSLQNLEQSLVEGVAANLPVYTISRSGGVRWCRECRVVKPDRCHHCSSCQRCVLKMDHHCPWLGWCIVYCIGLALSDSILPFCFQSDDLSVYCIMSMKISLDVVTCVVYTPPPPLPHRVNNCVGYSNYKFFLLFLFYTVFVCVYIDLATGYDFVSVWVSVSACLGECVCLSG